jgi:multiple sugar transport system substrate-binding protein
LQKTTVTALAVAVSLVACTSTSPELTAPSPTVVSNKSLTIMWDKGYVLEEDEAIEQVVTGWEQQSGNDAKLAFYNSGEIAPKTLRSSQAGAPPDVLFAAKSLYPISDWKGKLADVTDLIQPHKASYMTSALQAATIYGTNRKEKEQRYYAVPLAQDTTHIYYWKDLLQQAGYRPEDIPTDWDSFWQFWKTAQEKLEAKGQPIRALGLPLSIGAMDVYRIFEHVLAAYEVQILNAQGELQVDRPEIRQGIIQCLNWYIQLYRAGYVPQNATNWLDPDNNRNLLDRTVLMTPNPSLSIPAAIHNDPETYRKLGTIEFPNKPNGEPLPHLVTVRQAVIFADAPHATAAKSFLAYLVQPNILNRFLKAAYGRFLPVTTQLQQDPFWLDPADPHISTVATTIAEGRTRPFNNVLNPAYGVFLEENVWGQVLHQMAVENLSAEAAADRAIARLRQIFAETE